MGHGVQPRSGLVVTGYNAAVRRFAMPARIAALPVSPQGFPVPYFVQQDPVDFRVVRPEAFMAGAKQGRCWTCGQPRGRTFAFVAGPMCGLNRTSSEPPSHRECAEYAAKVCPFLARPAARRNEKNLPEHGPVAGFHLDRNPGVALVWVTRSFRPFRPHAGGAGVLIEMGEPLETLWFCEGRPARRGEVFHSIETGLPHLLALCESEATPALRLDAKRELYRRLREVTAMLPAEETSAA